MREENLQQTTNAIRTDDMNKVLTKKEGEKPEMDEEKKNDSL